MRAAVAFLAVLSMSGGRIPAAEDVDFRVIPDRPFEFRPSLSAELLFPTARSAVGFGNFDLTAEPEEDAIGVDLLVGTPTSDPAWAQCPGLRLVIDGREDKVATSYVGVPMRSGVFDALSAKLSILHVREMAEATTVRIGICGEEVELGHEQRRSLVDFVRRFDDIAVYDGESLPSPPPELGPEHEWGEEEPVNLPFPV